MLSVVCVQSSSGYYINLENTAGCVPPWVPVTRVTPSVGAILRCL